MKIYTKTGDNGSTGLQGNHRLKKSDPRIIAYGSIDEINASLGIILSGKIDSDIREVLIRIQNDLFVAGADLSNPNLHQEENRITASMVKWIEESIDDFEKVLTPLTNFILPGGDISASQLQFTRTIVRRSEICIVNLKNQEEINENCLKYINRLSDLFFVLGRVINKRKGKNDVLWKG